MPPEITEPPQADKETVDGKTVELTCRTFGAPKPIVKWFHDNDELTGGRFELKENGDLRIKYVSNLVMNSIAMKKAFLDYFSF